MIDWVKFFTSRRFYSLLSALLFVFFLFLVGMIYFPEATRDILIIIWIGLFFITIIFMGLGVFVLLGLKKEVSKIMDLLLEGSLTLIDLHHLFKEIVQQFIEEIREFIVHSAPIFSGVAAILLYANVLILYRYLGLHGDITLFTVVLTIIIVSIVGLMTLKPIPKAKKTDFSDRFFKSFLTSFRDWIEVVIFLFFLTLDTPNLFFIPEKLDVTLQANLKGFDLMQTSFTKQGIQLTLTLIIIAILSEILKIITRVTFFAHKRYKELNEINSTRQRKFTHTTLIKHAIRVSFRDQKDDTIKFTAFTTFLLLVFLFFPRLKVLSMAVASLTTLALDFILPERIKNETGNDLISRFIVKAFKL